MESELERAVRVLREGGLVAFPTETVYGLGADATNPAAVRRVFEAKGRPPGHPLIVHVPSADHLERWARDVPDAARALAERFWPGPLTLILARRDDVPAEVTGGQPTIGVRVPDHPVAAALLDAFGGGIAAPSANRFGSVSPTTAAHVASELGDSVDVILDGGPCRVGVESTIVDLSGDLPRLVRPGGVTREALEEIIGELHAPSATVRAPGTLDSHYAPRAEVRAVRPTEIASAVETAQREHQRVVVLAEEAITGTDTIVIGKAPEERARRIYAALREVDERGFTIAIVALPEERGLDAAVADRLRRAAAPRGRPDGT